MLRAAEAATRSEEHARFAREAVGDPINRLQALGVQFAPPDIDEIMDGEGASS
jgi:hypothetical protein